MTPATYLTTLKRKEPVVYVEGKPMKPMKPMKKISCVMFSFSILPSSVFHYILASHLCRLYFITSVNSGKYIVLRIHSSK